jgi:hypothetical protein
MFTTFTFTPTQDSFYLGQDWEITHSGFLHHHGFFLPLFRDLDFATMQKIIAKKTKFELKIDMSSYVDDCIEEQGEDDSDFANLESAKIVFDRYISLQLA